VATVLPPPVSLGGEESFEPRSSSVLAGMRYARWWPRVRGLRLGTSCRTLSVRSTTDSGVAGSGVYETAKAVDEYVQFHYADPADLLPYPVSLSFPLPAPRRKRRVVCQRNHSPPSQVDVIPTAALDFPARCAELCLESPGCAPSP